MRRTVLALVFLALATAACSSGTTAVPAPTAAPYAPAPAIPAATAGPTGATQAYPRFTPRPYPTAVPTSGAYDGVTYADPGVNPTVDTNVDHRSTFGLDVDTASYGIAKRYLADGNLPDPSSVRVEEFVNAFDQGYAPPLDGTFAIHADGAPSPFLSEDELLLRVGIKARDVHDRVRAPAALTFVIDVSGSMAREVAWSS